MTKEEFKAVEQSIIKRIERFTNDNVLDCVKALIELRTNKRWLIEDDTIDAEEIVKMINKKLATNF